MACRKPVPETHKKPERTTPQCQVIWFADPRVRGAWAVRQIGTSGWTVGYRIAARDGVPHIAEQTMWPNESPPWWPTRDEPPRPPPNLDRAQRALSARQALAAWRDEGEWVSWDGRALQPVPSLLGFDPTAPARARRGDDFYAHVADRYMETRAGKNYARKLAEELDVTPGTARKYVRRCHERGLINGDELTPYARRLLVEQRRRQRRRQSPGSGSGSAKPGGSG
jgi:hypothetical protein